MNTVHVRSPLAWILAACAVIRLVGLGWGLPASDGWDNDGIAPRDFLAGLVETFTPGHYFTYPPFHLLLLGVLTSPITAVGLAKAASLSQHDVVAEMLKVPYMTALALVARTTSLVMSLGITYAVAKMAEVIRGPRAGWLAAAFVGLNLTLTYYAHTTNLDVPYLFWSSFALLEFIRAMANHEPARFRRAAVFMALATATKDQAYAVFLVSVPVALAAWFAFDPEARRSALDVVRSLLRAVVIAALLFLVLDAIIINPSGFRARVGFLTGPASQDFAQYSNDWAGRLKALRMVYDHYTWVTPALLALIVATGFVVHASRVRSEPRGKWLAGLLPALAAVSFTLAFNCVARRVEHRFVLPQEIFLAVYGGIGMDALLSLARRPLLALSQAAIAVGLGQEAFLAFTVDNALVQDPRYGAERWMREHVAPGDRIETYGLNVYLPRFPATAHVTRVGREPPERRNPMPGFEEVQDLFGNVEQRKPKYIVVAEGWAWRYLDAPSGPSGGAITPLTQMKTKTDPDGTEYFHALREGRRGYREVFAQYYDASVFPWMDIHASTARPVWIFERN